VYGPALPTRADLAAAARDLAAAAREERDTQLRIYIIFAHRWKCNVIVCEINKLYIRISPQYVHNFFPL
jgi:predicted HNH restriction endonuclease